MKRVIHTHGRHMRVKKPRIIHQHNRRGQTWWGLLVLSLFLGVLWGVYEYGLQAGGFHRQLVRQEIQHLKTQLEEQRELNDGLRSESVRYKREAEIERQANLQLQRDLANLRDRNAQLAAEIELLQSLISNDAGSLYVKNLRIWPADENGHFHYRFTLVQVKEKIATTQGKLLFKLSGRQKGKKLTLERAKLAPDGKKAIKLAFSHYQDVEGVIVLPEGFEPSTLEIEFLPRNKELKKMRKRFSWRIEDNDDDKAQAL